MKFCIGTVCWGGYLERYVDIFVNNYITIWRRLIGLGTDYSEIADPKICSLGDKPGPKTEEAIKKLELVTGKKLQLVQDRHKYVTETVMHITRNRLRTEFKDSYPNEKKVFFYFPIDDNIRSTAAVELIALKYATKPTACMFKFLVDEGLEKYTAATRPICSWNDIHPGDWGGYCAYNILNENECPLYPPIDIPNVAFYADLYKAGYKQYQSKEICIDHLRHKDSHHYKYKDTEMSNRVKDYLMKQRTELYEKGYK